jgi:hypothetical protein
MSVKKNIKPILLTGSHRSGTTWAGLMLAAAPHIAYIHEPFNREVEIGLSPRSFKQTFKYICEENSEKYGPWFEGVLSYKYPLKRNITKITSFEDVFDILGQQSSFVYHRLKGDTPLIKDPIALFSAEWLCQRFNMNVMVMIRHPAAFCSSLKIKNWRFSFKNFLEQPVLMEQYLGKFRSEIEEYSEKQKDIIDQGILLWNCMHHTINLYRENNPTWLFIKHEDLSLDPLSCFKTIYKDLGLQFTPKVRKKIIKSSGSHNPVEQQKENEFLRNSRENIYNWKKRLSPDEIMRIRRGTAEISRFFYDEQEW